MRRKHAAHGARVNKCIPVVGMNLRGLQLSAPNQRLLHSIHESRFHTYLTHQANPLRLHRSPFYRTSHNVATDPNR